LFICSKKYFFLESIPVVDHCVENNGSRTAKGATGRLFQKLPNLSFRQNLHIGGKYARRETPLGDNRNRLGGTHRNFRHFLYGSKVGPKKF